MWKRILIPALAAALQVSPLEAGQIVSGVGPFTFVLTAEEPAQARRLLAEAYDDFAWRAAA